MAMDVHIYMYPVKIQFYKGKMVNFIQDLFGIFKNKIRGQIVNFWDLNKIKI